MQIIHVMKDGTTRDSIEGVVIQSEDFYRVIQRLREKNNDKENQDGL